jgi:hypothetical protein
MTSYEQEAFSRIWGNVNRPERGCWRWRGKSRGVAGGYHQVNVGYHPETGNNILKIASRFVYEVMYGGPLPKGMQVAHLCDTTDCIKPTHLVMATQAQNERMKDPRRRAEDRRRTLKVVR